MKHVFKKITAGLIGFFFLGSPAFAQAVVGVTVADSGDTAWLMTGSVLALLMIVLGLVLFYAGQLDQKRAVSAGQMVLAVMSAASLLWVMCGYSLAFSEGSNLLGGLDNVMLANLAEIRVDTTVPETAFVLFQMMLAVLASALMIASVIDRARFGWLLCLALLWSLIVYVPIAHWLWGNGWLANFGAHDFAGGVVILTSAGVSALVMALMLKPQRGLTAIMRPAQSPIQVMAGAALLWAGWLALSGASTLTASDDAATAMINTHVSACAGALVWALIERVRGGTLSGTGTVSGGIAGLSASMAAAGYVGPLGAIILGGLAALLCYGATGLIKDRLKIDDTLNVFAVFGVGGIMGALAFPLFVLPAFGGPGFDQGVSLVSQLIAQLVAVGAVAAWSAGVTLMIGFSITLILPMLAAETEIQ